MQAEEKTLYGGKMILLYAIHNTNTNHKLNDAISAFMPIISEGRRRKVEKFIQQNDKNRSILAEVLLKYILSKHYDVLWNEIKFEYNEFGKPFLVGREDIWFNISHSGDWIICGVSNAPIGVDVEHISNDILDIAKRFFTIEEYRYIQGQVPDKQNEAFFKIWTLKESYIKCVGKGLTIPLESFSINLFNDLIQLYIEGILSSSYTFVSEKLDEDYYMAICVKSNDCEMWDRRVNIILVEELIGLI